jgi:YVTN family beta-propeller protein
MMLLAAGVLLGLSVSLGHAAEVIATIPVSGEQTAGVGVNSITNRVYVAGISSDTVSVIDGVTNAVIATVPVGSGQGVDVHPVTNRVYVVNTFSQTVSVIDGTTNSVVATVEGLAFRPRLVGVNPTTNRVYVNNHGNGSERTVAVIDGDSNTIIDTVTVGAGPHGIGVNPITNRVYAGNDVDNTVSVIDGATNSVIATIPVGGRPLDLGVNPVTNRIYVSNYNDNTVSVIDGATNSVITTIAGLSGPRGIGVNPGTNRLYVCNLDAASVSVIDGTTNEVIETVAVGNAPVDCEVNPSTDRVYVADFVDNTVSVIEDAEAQPCTAALFAGTGHSYEFVSAPGISWQEAKIAAEARSCNGIPGYLATITSAEENAFIANMPLPTNAWLGGTDQQGEGEWRWATGPEAGTQFWQGNSAGTPVGGAYTNWASGEPNDVNGGEDHLWMYSSFSAPHTVGQWNDDEDAADGYVVEYSALPAPCVQPPAGLVGWWPGDGSTEDLIGGRNAVLRDDATVGPGLVDQALILDGDGDFVEVPHDPALNVGSGDFTVDLWVYFNDTAGEQVLIEKWVQRFPGSRGWTLTKLDGNVLRLAMASGDGNETNIDSGVLSIPTGTWTHFAVTRQGSAITLFMNGVPVTVGASPLNLDSDSSLKFGHRGSPDDTPGSQDTSGFFLNGRIDEVQLFVGRALSEAEILAIVNCKIVNDLVAFEPLPSTYRFTTDITGCPTGFVGTFSFEAMLTNISASALSNLLVEVTTLTDGNLLLNADEGPGGVGSHLTVPRLDGFTDGVLSAEEFVDVPFAICVREHSPFSFFVDVVGVIGTPATQTQVLLPYLSPGYRFLVVPFGEGGGFEQPDFDDAHFAVGDAPFGTGGSCPLDATVQTLWPLETDLLLRKTFRVPANATMVRVAVAIDNDVQVFINGVDISSGLQQSENCTERDRFIFAVPESLLVFDGENLLAVRARDRGVISYVDVEIRAMLPLP